MSASMLMIDALAYDVIFYLGEDCSLKMEAPQSIVNDAEVMALIRSQKTAIQKQVERGFGCVRDGLSIAEVKALTAAAQRGCVVSLKGWIA